MITLSNEQTQAYNAINTFIASKDQIFVLHGLAGTGKTSIISIIANEQAKSNKKTELCAFTGKATSVLAVKANFDARTIHSLFYRLVEKGVNSDGKPVLVWERVFKPGSLKGSLVLVDESSMVNDLIGKDLESTGAKIIACGDPGQLQPVQGVQYFTEPNFVLTEIHRQALESPIIRQAHSVRNNGRYVADGDQFRITDEITINDLTDTDVVLCWKNQTRTDCNYVIRQLKGYEESYPMAGETIMCLKNARDFGIYNGAVYTLLKPFKPKDKYIFLDIDGFEIRIPNCVFVKPGETVGDYSKRSIISAFDYGYALTVHKAQGSEWKKVLLLDEYSYSDDRKKWLYTGITRASERILIKK